MGRYSKMSDSDLVNELATWEGVNSIMTSEIRDEINARKAMKKPEVKAEIAKPKLIKKTKKSE